MRSNAPCFQGVLPRPKRELVGEKLIYYVDAVDRKFSASRTPETTAEVCETSGSYPMRFSFEVDGTLLTAGCRSTITFGANQATAGSAGGASEATLPSSKRYSVQMSIRSEAANNDPKAQRSLTVEVTSAAIGCSADTQGPVVTLTKPSPGASYPSPNAYPVRLEAFADDSGTGNNGIRFVQYKVNYPGPDQQVLGPVTSGGPWRFDWSQSAITAWIGVPCNKTASIEAYAEDNCGHGAFSNPVSVDVRRVGGNCFLGLSVPGSEASSALVSELDVPGGTAQVVVNGEASFPRGGRHPLAFRFTPGANRVEATLVEGRGPGVWRFDVSAAPGLRPESLRVVAGEVVQAGVVVVGFRLRGRSGERIVFSFEIE